MTAATLALSLIALIAWAYGNIREAGRLIENIRDQRAYEAFLERRATRSAKEALERMAGLRRPLPVVFKMDAGMEMKK